MASGNLVFGMAIQLASRLFSLAVRYLGLLRMVCMRRACLLAFWAAFRVVGRMVLPAMARGVFGAGLVFVWDGARGERFNFCFSRVFC